MGMVAEIVGGVIGGAERSDAEFREDALDG